MKNESSALVLKTVVYKAAWNIKKAVYRYRMRQLKKAAIKQCAKSSFSLFSRKIPATCSKEMLHKAMKDLWNEDYNGFYCEYWHIGGGDLLDAANKFLKLVNISSTKYIRLAASDAVVLEPYM